MPIEISVNLATHNRAAFLEPCLVSLCEQTLDPTRYEICVVANACTDDTAAVVDRIAARYPHHRIFRVDEPEPGLSRARNRGIQATLAPLVAFVDDDGSVYPDWLTRFLTRFSEMGNNLAVVGGEIEPIWGVPKPDWLTMLMQSLLTAGTGFGPQPRFLGPYECVCECNCCYRRDALVAAGNFPVELGRVGSCLLSGEGIVDMSVRRNGGQAFFDPDILLKHHIHAERLTPSWLKRRFFWQGISSVAICHYEARRGIASAARIDLSYPLTLEDWELIDKDTPSGLERNAQDLQGLGFILALTGIIPIKDVALAGNFLKTLSEAPPVTPMELRQRSFWLGVADYAARLCMKQQGGEVGPDPGTPVLLGHAAWTFINNRNELPTKDHLEALRGIGYRLARAGFIHVE